MRLIAFVGVLALIVGTSVSLASADERSAAPPVAKKSVAKEPTVERAVAKETPVDTATAPTATVGKAAPSKSEAVADDSPASSEADTTAVADTPDAVAVDPAATAGSASGEIPQARLPLTGDVQVRWLLLGGAGLVLVGMLVQVAGQPLPARAGTHVRGHARARA